MTTRMQRTIGTVALLSGLVLLGIGLILGFGGVSQYGISCGSGFGGFKRDAAVTAAARAIQAEQYGANVAPGLDFLDSACSSAVSDRKTLAWALTGPGIGLALVGAGFLIVATPAREPRLTDEARSDSPS